MTTVAWTRHIVPVIVLLLTLRVVYLVTYQVVTYVERHMVEGGRL